MADHEARRPTAVGETQRNIEQLRRSAAHQRAEAHELRERALHAEQEALTCERVANEYDALLTKAGEA